MTTLGSAPRVALQQLRGVLVAALPVSLTPELLLQLRRELLSAALRTQPRAVLLDASALEVMDAADFRSLCDTARLCRIMGGPTIACGFSPGVVSALVDFEVDVRAIDTARDVDAAIAWLDRRGDEPR